MSKQTNISLAGETFTVQRLAVRQAIAWRNRAEALLSALPELGKKFEQDADNAETIGILGLADGLLESLIALVFSASPELQAQEERILETLDDGDLFEAFQSLLVLNLPLASVVVNQPQPTGNGEATTTT